MKKLIALLLALVMCFGTVAFVAADEAAKEDVYVLYTNDVHCGYKTGLGYTGVAAIKKMLIAQGKNVILADNGDAIQGDTIGSLSKGTYITDIMNFIGYDVAIPGNHEFDYGMAAFMAVVEKANFPYTSCNFQNIDGTTALNQYVVIEKGGVKIAFVGLSTPKTFTASTPTYFQDGNGNYIYSFCEDTTGDKMVAAVQAAVDAARAEGVDYVVAMGHLGIEADCSPWTSSEIISRTNGIDVFLDGHSHSVIPNEKVQNKDGEDVLLTSTGTKLEYLGCLKIAADGTFSSDLIYAPSGVFADAETSEFISTIDADFAELVNTVVAHTDVDLIIKDPVTGERIVRNSETNLADLCADAYRAESGAQIAIINGGGVRDTIPAGDITYGQIIKVHPFGNSMCVVKTTGQQILDALELSVSKLPSEFGGWLVPSGMKFTIDMNVDSTVVLSDKGEFLSVAGDRRVKDVVVLNDATGEYEPIDPAAYYTLACHNYKLKSGGDGYTMFKNDPLLLDEVMIDNMVLINYIVYVLGGSVGEEYSNPYGQGRITFIEKAA